MFFFDKPGERVIMLLTAGNLAVTQEVIGMVVFETAKAITESADLWTALEHAGVVGMPALHFLDAPEE